VSGYRGAARSAAWLAVAITVLAVAGGCARLDAALGQQWIVVQFAPGTTVAAARRITAACATVPGVRLAGPVRPTSAQPGVVDSVRYDATRASDADMADLQTCLERFPAVQGITLTQPGDG